eukprot:m.244647 g.244647  ORF g.244647 m.244647 type:complete len:442 (-) comp14490_c0_seq1:233-1558(-)
MSAHTLRSQGSAGSLPESISQIRRSSMGAHRDANELNAVVMLTDGTEFEIPCKNGKYTSGEELRELVARRIGLAPEYTAMFAVWIMSGSLSLEMKAHHFPFKVLKQWGDLLEGYSLSAEYELPMMYFKRAALVPQDDEILIDDPTVVKLLFAEMTFSVQYGLYPCTIDEAARLAAIHLHIARGDAAKKDDVYELEACEIPEHLEKAIKFKAWAKKVLEAREEITLPHTDRVALQQQYLTIGRLWPYYGATFYFGEIEATTKHLLWDTPDELVRVGVNIDGIHVIADAKNKLRLSLGYDELRYNSYADDAGGSPCFILEHSRGGQTQQTVIWSKQATIIDTLVSRFLELQPRYASKVAARKALRGVESVELSGESRRIGFLGAARQTLRRLRAYTAGDEEDSRPRYPAFTLSNIGAKQRGRVPFDEEAAAGPAPSALAEDNM